MYFRALSFYEGPIAPKLFQLGRTTQGMPGSGHQLISFLATGNFLFQNSSRAILVHEAPVAKKLVHLARRVLSYINTWPERIYNSHYCNGVPAMFTS